MSLLYAVFMLNRCERKINVIHTPGKKKKKRYENHTQKIGELCFKIAPEMEDGPQAESSKWQQTGV